VLCLSPPLANLRVLEDLLEHLHRHLVVGIWNWGLLCAVPIRAHFNTSHDKAHCALYIGTW
jgi:hypothetical protein